MKNVSVLFLTSTVLLVVGICYGAEHELKHFRGVVTYHLIPAKVIRVNEIVQNPEPGTSFIGEDGLFIEFEGTLDVMANWSVVNVEYYGYKEPKTIHYKAFGEEYKVSARYHAERVVVDGDISQYVQQ